MTRTYILPLIAAAALAGCNNSDHTIVAGGPDTRGESNAPPSDTPVTLPPSIAASKVYRCEDNSVIYVDWLSDGTSANVRSSESGTPTRVTTDTPGTPMKGEGIAVAGAAPDRMVVVTRPGKPSIGCKV